MEEDYPVIVNDVDSNVHRDERTANDEDDVRAALPNYSPISVNMFGEHDK